MFSKAFTAAVVLAASTLVSAQTFTDCNPLKKSCPADPAFGSNGVNCDFTKGACDAFQSMVATSLTYNGKGANFVINKESDAPTIKSGHYLFFGRVDVVVQAALGQGIVTSSVLQSDDLDEIDWEWVGGDNAQAQTNYFSKGDTTTYNRGAYHPVSAPLTSYHKYSVIWTSTAVNWLIDDNVVRTLNAADANGGASFPQTPMQVKLGTWVAGGKDTAKGTVEWAGGYTDFDDAPFNAYYKSITIEDYAGQDAPGKNSNIKEYVYGDNSGTWESIEIKKGDGSDDDTTTTSTTSTTSTTKKPTSTKDASTTSTSEATKTTETSETSTSISTSTSTTTEDDKETETTKSETTTKGTSLTTLQTVTATSSGSGSEGTDSSDSESSGSPGSASASATGTAPSETISTVPTNAASHMTGNFGAAAAGLFVLQFLI